MRKILLDFAGRLLRVALLEDGVLKRLIVEDLENQSLIGNVYNGLVKNVTKSGFAFVDIGIGKNAFLQLDDKQAGKEKAIKQGDSITVIVRKDSAGDMSQKSCRLSTRLEDTELPQAVLEKAPYIKAPALLYKPYSPELKVIRELWQPGTQIISNRPLFDGVATAGVASVGVTFGSDSSSSTISDVPADFSLDFSADCLCLYSAKLPLFQEYFIETEIDKLLSAKVWLKSGGFLLIEETETCVVIDVNTGKGVKKDYESTILTTNLEAAQEIARQVCLRNLSGMIIVDFIPMKNTANNPTQQLSTALSKALESDPYKCRIMGVTSAGLFQLTRQKVRGSLASVLLGLSTRPFSPLYHAGKLYNHLWATLSNTIYRNLRVTASEAILQALKRGPTLTELEKRFDAKISLCVEEGNKGSIENLTSSPTGTIIQDRKNR